MKYSNINIRKVIFKKIYKMITDQDRMFSKVASKCSWILKLFMGITISRRIYLKCEMYLSQKVTNASEKN